MQFVRPDINIDFVGKRKIAIMISAVVIAAGLVYIALFGLNYGIEFKGGTEVRIKPSRPISIKQLRKSVVKLGYRSPTVQTVGSSDEYLIYVNKIIKSTQSKGIADKIISGIKKSFPGNSIDLRSVNSIGPKFGKTLKEKAILAIIIATIAILIYVSIRFRFRFAVGAVIALIHDVLVTLAFIAIFHFQFTLQILAAILTIIGYSLNDTIVVYDRIRENIRLNKKKSTFEKVINKAINETLSRTILTSGTTLLVVAVLFFFGGAVIHGFSFALLVGIVSGTYSSIYIASPILLIFKKPIDIGGNLEASNDKEISKQDKITDQRQKKSPANKSKRKRSQKVAYKV